MRNVINAGKRYIRMKSQIRVPRTDTAAGPSDMPAVNIDIPPTSVVNKKKTAQTKSMEKVDLKSDSGRTY
jgi:hypothetical protein